MSLKVKMVYFNGTFPVPGEKSQRSYFTVGEGFNFDFGPHGVTYSNGKQAYWIPYVNLNYMVVEPEAGAVPVETIDLSTDEAIEKRFPAKKKIA